MPQNVRKHCVRTRFAKSLYSYKSHAEVQTRMAETLIEELRRLQFTRFESVLEIGCGSGLLTERFLKTFQADTFYANDLVESCEEMVSDIVRQYPQGNFTFIGGDIEQHVAELPGELDLLISNATFQWLEDFESFLPRLKAHMKPNGTLAFSTFGPHNLSEIRHLSGNSLTYLRREAIQDLLKQHFQVMTCSEELVPLTFPSPRQVLNHLRLTGVNGVSQQKWTKSNLKTFEQRYREEFGHEGQVSLTYHPILCLVRNPNSF